MKTVGQIIAELSAFPADLPVLTGTAYDNDAALTDDVRVVRQVVSHAEGEFYMPWDSGDPGDVDAVTIM